MTEGKKKKKLGLVTTGTMAGEDIDMAESADIKTRKTAAPKGDKGGASKATYDIPKPVGGPAEEPGASKTPEQDALRGMRALETARLATKVATPYQPQRSAYDEWLAAHPIETAGQKARREKRERRTKLMAAIGDGLSAIANVVATSKGAKNMGAPNMTQRVQSRYDYLNNLRKQDEQRWQWYAQRAAATRSEAEAADAKDKAAAMKRLYDMQKDAADAEYARGKDAEALAFKKDRAAAEDRYRDARAANDRARIGVARENAATSRARQAETQRHNAAVEKKKGGTRAGGGSSGRSGSNGRSGEYDAWAWNSAHFPGEWKNYLREYGNQVGGYMMKQPTEAQYKAFNARMRQRYGSKAR